MKHKNNLFEVVDSEVDYVGMIFYEKSPRYMVDALHPEEVWFLPDEVEKVGVFVDAPVEDIRKYARLYQLDLIQLHGHETPEICAQVQDLGYPVIKAFGVDSDFDFKSLKAYSKVVDFFLFDTKSPQFGGSGEVFDWKLLENYSLDIPFFLGGGVSLENVKDLLQLHLPNLFAIDMNSKLEVEPGLKDITLVKEVVSAIRNTQL